MVGTCGLPIVSGGRWSVGRDIVAVHNLVVPVLGLDGSRPYVARALQVALVYVSVTRPVGRPIALVRQLGASIGSGPSVCDCSLASIKLLVGTPCESGSECK